MYSNEDSLSANSDSEEYMEAYDKLHKQLLKLFWNLAETILTPHQLEVMEMIADGETQEEIASKLGINQTSVHKSVFGRLIYGGDNITRRGGSVKKMKDAIAKNKKIQNVL